MVKNGQKWSKNGQSVQVGTAYKSWSQHLFSMRKVSSKPNLTKNSSAAAEAFTELNDTFTKRCGWAARPVATAGCQKGPATWP